MAGGARRTGYAQSFLIWERFGYPDFLAATGNELIEAPYSDRPDLRPIYDAIIQAAAGFGQSRRSGRKTYVSLLTPRRTSAVHATTKSRVTLDYVLRDTEREDDCSHQEFTKLMRIQISLVYRTKLIPRSCTGCSGPTTRIAE